MDKQVWRSMCYKVKENLSVITNLLVASVWMASRLLLVVFLKLRSSLILMPTASCLSQLLTRVLERSKDITITGASTLPKDEVDKMVQEAERFAKEDKEKRDAIETKNQAESVMFQTEKQLKELGDKVPADVKGKVEAKLKELKDAVSGGATQAIKDAMAALNQEVMQLGQSLYNQPGGAPGAGPTPGPDAGPSNSSAKPPTNEDGDVIDADFSEN